MRPRLILVSILLLAVLAYFLNISNQESLEVSLSTSPQQRDYDYYMADIDSTHFALNNQADYRIQAQRLTHYPDPNFAIVEFPDLIIYTDNEPPWFVSADSGRIEDSPSSAEDKIDLSNNVIIRHTDNQGQSINIYTEFLTIYPNTKKLSTDLDILLESANSKILSTGMKADLTLNKLDLLANVRGTYEQVSTD